MDIKHIVDEVKKDLFKEVELLIYPCRDDIELPKYAHAGDACMDIRAAIDITIKPNETVLIPTGLKLIIPKGYELQVKARSGISLHTPLRISNSIGVIDSGYRDELGVIYTNTSLNNTKDNKYLINEKGNKQGTYDIKKGDRIAQISLHKIINTKIIKINESDYNSDDTNRGGGLGHSGIK